MSDIIEEVVPHVESCHAAYDRFPDIYKLEETREVVADFYCTNESADPECPALLRVFIGKLPDPDYLPGGKHASS